MSGLFFRVWPVNLPLQEMVKQEFRGRCTVLTIAHRLATVAFYDQVIVLGGGQVLEHGPPLDLLRKPLVESPRQARTTAATESTTTTAVSSTHVESSATATSSTSSSSSSSSVRASTSAAAEAAWVDPCPFRRLAEVRVG